VLGPQSVATYAVRVDPPLVLASAYRHGFTEDQILHAYLNALDVEFEDGHGLTMLVGPDQTGRLLEIGLVEKYETDCIVHADDARPKFLPRR
jgi:hypothetical protein